jgi:4-amino-4-deoxy-L-arabinose transferase-like glycosyltransferase
VLLALGSAALYLGLAGAPALVDDDIDAAHALVAHEMLQRHDWVVPYQDGIRYLIRPPLHFWLVAVSYRLFGETEFATRLPVALAMVGLVLLIYDFGRRFFGERAGLYAGMAAATSAGMYVFTRTVIPEAIYALELTAVFYFFLLAWTGRLDARIGFPAAAAACALAVLTRGPIGLLFPAAAVAVFLTATGSWGCVGFLRLPSSIAVFLVIAAPWHLLAASRAPGWAWAYFVNEHVNRALGTRRPHDYGAVPLWLWLLEHLLWLFPWSAFGLLAVRLFPSRARRRDPDDTNAQVCTLLFAWAGVIIAFFAVESGSRMEYYSFGAWPALALLLGAGLAEGERTGRRALVWASRSLAALAAVFVLAAAWFLARAGAPRADVASDLRTQATESYTSSMARVGDLTPEALADLRIPILVSAAALGLGFVGSWILRERRRDVASNVMLAAGMCGTFVAANLAYVALQPSMSSRGLAREIGRTLRPADEIVLYGDIRLAPGIAFYCRRRVLLYHATESNLEFGARYPDAPRTFLSDDEFRNLWSGPDRVFLVAAADRDREALGRLSAGSARVFAKSGDKTVYVNRAGEN